MVVVFVDIGDPFPGILPAIIWRSASRWRLITGRLPTRISSEGNCSGSSNLLGFREVASVSIFG